MKKLEPWKVITEKDVSPSPWFPVFAQLVQLPGGQQVEYFLSRLGDVAMIVPITQHQEIVFVRQYKHGIGRICLELPAGRMEHHTSPQLAAQAELEEETGIQVEEQQLVPLGELWPAPSKDNTTVYCFLAQDVRFNSQQHQDETENIEVVVVPLAELDDRIISGEIQGSDTLAALLLVQKKFPKLFRSLISQ